MMSLKRKTSQLADIDFKRQKVQNQEEHGKRKKQKKQINKEIVHRLGTIDDYKQSQIKKFISTGKIEKTREVENKVQAQFTKKKPQVNQTKRDADFKNYFQTQNHEQSKKQELEKVTVSAKLPLKPEDFSSNWKKMLKMQRKQKKKAVKQNVFVKEKNQQKETVKSPEIWFDGVDDIYLEMNLLKKEHSLVKEKSFDGLTKTVAMDCEMVGVGEDGEDSILARVSIVNQFGKCVYDKYVKATEKVTDYRTPVSGIRRKDMENGVDFKIVQQEVSDILKDRILVGHALHNDIKVLYLDHPHKMIRDTQQYKPFKKLFAGRKPSLKNLTAKVLTVEVQQGEHSSVQDAQAAMRLYTMHKTSWEKELSEKWKHKPASNKRKRHKKKNNIELKKEISKIIDSDSD